MLDVEKVVPKARFVALHYVHEPKGRLLDGIRKVTRDRVLQRGDNHQTIRAGSKSNHEIIEIMEGFLNRFQSCNREVSPDNNFDDIIDLDVTSSSLENLEAVITHLYNEYRQLMPPEMPTTAELQEAIEFAMNDEVKLKHDLSFNKDKQNDARQGFRQMTINSVEAQSATVDQLVKKLEYFGVSVPTTRMNSLLSSLFANSSAEDGRMYAQLKGSRRIQDEFHVTLLHRANASAKPGLWETYVTAYRQANPQSGIKAAPNLGTARVQLETLVWDTKIMAFVVRMLPGEDGQTWQMYNGIAHITVGTASQDIKPKESSQLLAQWMEGNRADIREKQVPKGTILDGIVKPVLQRGH